MGKGISGPPGDDDWMPGGPSSQVERLEDVAGDTDTMTTHDLERQPQLPLHGHTFQNEYGGAVRGHVVNPIAPGHRAPLKGANESPPVVPS